MNSNIYLEMDRAIDLIESSKNIYLASHVQPDGDNIGSILALALALKKIKDNVFLLKTDEVPSDFLFLPQVDLIKDYEDLDDIDLFISLDSSDLNRLGKNKSLFQRANNTISIDHHVSNTNYANINVVDENSSATGEIVFDFINRLNIKIDKDIATCIYTAISTDTGSFMYDNVTEKTHDIVAELIKIGIDKSNININLYQSRSIERTNLFIKAFSTLNTFNDNKIATVKVTEEMLLESGAKMEDTEGIISFIREIAPVEVACLFKEFGKKETKVSMRSKRYVDVSSICNNFNGGGHIRAAGCTIYEDIITAENIIVEKIKESIR